MPEIQPIIEDDRFFIKSFIIDADLNLNYWAATDAAIDEHLSSFIGKPFVITPEFGHPDARDGEDLMIQQEKFRVGEIIEVGRSPDGTAWAISEITDETAKQQLTDKEVMFVSPSVTFNTATDIISIQGKDIITKFEAAHLAGVKEPAYGMQKAQIKGQCGGSFGTCKPILDRVQASVEKSACGKFNTITEDDGTVRIRKAEEKPTQVCTKCSGECKCSSNKAKKDSNDNNMSEEQKDDKKESNEEELEEKRKEEARKAEQEKKDKEEADEDKDAPLDAEEDEDRKEKDARIKALEAELAAEKSSFINQIVAAKKAGGHILEAEEKSEVRKLEAETLVTLKQLAAEYTEKAEASQGKSKPYHVLEYSQAETFNGDAFLKKIGAKSD